MFWYSFRKSIFILTLLEMPSRIDSDATHKIRQKTYVNGGPIAPESPSFGCTRRRLPGVAWRRGKGILSRLNEARLKRAPEHLSTVAKWGRPDAVLYRRRSYIYLACILTAHREHNARKMSYWSPQTWAGCSPAWRGRGS